jgi:hypothetical protein
MQRRAVLIDTIWRSQSGKPRHFADPGSSLGLAPMAFAECRPIKLVVGIDEAVRGPAYGPPLVRVADVDRKEFEEADRGLLAGSGGERRESG